MRNSLFLLGWVAVVSIAVLALVEARRGTHALDARIQEVEDRLSVLAEEKDWIPLGFDNSSVAERALMRLYDACVVREAVTQQPVDSLKDLEKPLLGKSMGVTLRNDPWGNPYWFERLEPRSGTWSLDDVGLFRVLSAGPDGDRGTVDDIAYPTNHETVSGGG